MTLCVYVFSTAVLTGSTVNKQTNNVNRREIPTGRKLTSWLFTKCGGVEFGIPSMFYEVEIGVEIFVELYAST